MKIRNPNIEARNKSEYQNSNFQNGVLKFGYLDFGFVSIFDIRYSIFILTLLCVLIVGISGCTTEYNLATGQEETLMYGTDKEVKIGETIAPQIEAQFTVLTDVDANERVERILERIVAVCDRKDLVYFIKILDEDPVNAVSLPGGYIYVFRGLIEKADSDDELAGVIAHEVGHITARHSVKRMQGAYAAMLLQIASTQTSGQVAGGVNLALNSLFMEYSQADEFEADRLGVKYLKKAGYDPEAMVAFLQKLKAESEREPLRRYSYWKTHPNLSQRISVVKQSITGKLEFRDYLNLPGNEY